MIKLNQNLNQEEIVRTFQTETGDFVLKRLVTDWYSIAELSKLWFFHKNLGLNLSTEVANWFWKNKKRLHKLWSNYQNLKSHENNSKGFKIFNPFIDKLVKDWSTYKLVRKEKVTKVYSRIRGGKRHQYPSTTNRYKVDLFNLFVFCLKYLVEKKHKSKTESYKSQVFKFIHNKVMVNHYKSLEEQEEQDFKKALDSLEETKNRLKVVLEDKDVTRQLVFSWVTDKEDTDFLGVVKRFITKWHEVYGLKPYLPVQEFEFEDRERLVNKVIETSKFLEYYRRPCSEKVVETVRELVQDTSYQPTQKQEILEKVVKPRVRLVLFYLSEEPLFVRYLTNEYTVYGFETLETITWEVLTYFNVLKPKVLEG